MMRARLYCLATLLGAGAIVALASTPTAMAIPECTQTGPTTIQCERPGNAQITTSPGVDNNHPPDLGQISAQARSRFAQVIVIVIDGGEEFARWWIELCCAPVELKSRLVEARVKSRSPSGVLAAFSAPFSAQVPPTFGAKMQVNDLGADRNVERDPSQGERLATKDARQNNLGSRRVCRLDGVVPLAVELVACDRQGVNVFGRVCDAGGVLIGVEDTMDGEPGRRCCVADQVDDHPVALQWSSAPVHGDLGEQPVFDFVPFAGARGQVADGDGQPALGGERGQLDLPGADPVAVGAAAVGAD